jgi:hypothetical protein
LQWTRRAATLRAAGDLFSGLGKKTFEFGSKLAEIAHRNRSHTASQDAIVRRNMASLRNRVKNPSS